MQKFITLCMVVRNESLVVRRVLDYLTPLFEDVIIGVQESEDKTLEICKEYATVIERPSESPEETRDIVMDQVITPWVLWLDADEFPSVSLMRWLEALDISTLTQYDSVSFIRVNYIDGFDIDGGQGTDRQFKMLKSNVRWNPKEQGRRIHIHPQVQRTLISDKV
jgi:hypothetical protein